jgi:hypothetical protein
MNLTLGSVSGFLPTIIKSLGYSNADAQLYTVPPYAVALVFMTSVSAISDRMKSRGPFVILVFTISSVGWIILLTVVGNQHARYFATFCVVIGGYAAIPLYEVSLNISKLFINRVFVGLWRGSRIIVLPNPNVPQDWDYSTLLDNVSPSWQPSSFPQKKDLDGTRALELTLPSI